MAKNFRNFGQGRAIHGKVAGGAMPEIVEPEIFSACMCAGDFPGRADIKRLLPIIAREDKDSIHTAYAGMLAQQFEP
jgi:hypothetical protein